MSQTLKKRGKKVVNNVVQIEEEIEKLPIQDKESDTSYNLALLVVTGLAIYTRFTKISFPTSVVFDEVHFGKFASYYLERTYFFDLHPPFAKLLIAFWGWLIGYDGSFKFESIGDDYISNNVPYIWYRSLLALQGVATIPIMFLTLKTLGFSVAACTFSSLIVCFDNAHIIDSRLILLDATLNLAVALTIFCYAKFSTYRREPFSSNWWKWLTLTGVSLSLVISTKYVGVFTYFTIGIAVLHELWILLDIKKGLTIGEFSKHFAARFWSLIVMPFIIYLFWFYLHFEILNKSGPGDSFMSSEFQESLLESPMARSAKDVRFGDIVTIKHKDTGAFLHSHAFAYPLRYEDGRISSNTQQVTAITDANAANDVNNQWEIVPVNNQQGDLYTEDVIRLRHVGTGGYLLTHDVASPLLATNEEFTIAHGDEAVAHFNETLFKIKSGETSNPNKRKLTKTKATIIKVLHVDTVVAMWTHNDELLPEWGFHHQEVSGNKKVQNSENIWTIDDIVNLSKDDKRSNFEPKKIKKIPFLKKWWELQGLMFKHNNQLTSDHPFASQPDSWPLALSGVSFWNDNDAKKQIFFTGNVIGFWIEVCLLAIYCGLFLADQITRRRDIHILTDKARSRLLNTLGFLFIGWAAHYFPFFLMNRQKFLHHYLPAHLIAALFSGTLLEFITSNNSMSNKKRPYGLDRAKLSALVLLLSIPIVWFFIYFKPIIYGDVSLTPAEVQKRQWLDISLHFAK